MVPLLLSWLLFIVMRESHLPLFFHATQLSLSSFVFGECGYFNRVLFYCSAINCYLLITPAFPLFFNYAAKLTKEKLLSWLLLLRDEHLIQQNYLFHFKKFRPLFFGVVFYSRVLAVTLFLLSVSGWIRLWDPFAVFFLLLKIGVSIHQFWSI